MHVSERKNTDLRTASTLHRRHGRGVGKGGQRWLSRSTRRSCLGSSREVKVNRISSRGSTNTKASTKLIQIHFHQIRLSQILNSARSPLTARFTHSQIIISCTTRGHLTTLPTFISNHTYELLILFSLCRLFPCTAYVRKYPLLTLLLYRRYTLPRLTIFRLAF